MSDDEVIVDVCGIPESAAQVGQQLAWLGAALRPSPREKGVTYCVPRLSRMVNTNQSRKSRADHARPPLEVTLKIEFSFEI